MNSTLRKLSILHILLTVRETSAPYNEHCLPRADQRDISICTYFESDVTPATTVTVFEGDGTVAGFMRALKNALDDKEYDIIHAHSPHVALLFMAGRFRAGRSLPSRTVVTVHDSYQNFKLRNRLMFLPVFAGFDRIVCCGQASYDSFPAVYSLLAGDRRRVVQNGLDIDRIDRLASSGRRQAFGDQFKVAAISRLVAVKNPSVVLDAFQESADGTSRLVIMGDGPMRNSLETQRSEAGLENQIEFMGVVPRETVFEHLLSADLFISASRGEGLPVSVLEAMACRCPVLLSDIPPHQEIAEGVDFIPLVQQDDAARFAREIERFRNLPASARKAIGQQCRTLVQQRFSLVAMHQGYDRLYAQLLSHETPLLLDKPT